MSPGMVWPRWEVQAWVTAPGEFPSQSLRKAWVHAADVPGAVRSATPHFEKVGIGPVVVSVVRVTPPASVA